MKPHDLPLANVSLASTLIGNTVLALMSEPEDARSGPEDMEVLVRTVSRCLGFGADAGPHHAQACAMAAGVMRELLSERSSAPAHCLSRGGGLR
ncbi:hypothetical protein GJ698_05300 [Pseudoduganella sp. FT26W]|uniref:Uncharacterized protein n=1 Tax=Duganella aquatilis TaxID=2666082 RepID=A0A844D5W7_9BURK|nr:hypothetical protein [Duganella aquatilis]MRW83506.1 hypothetical protein [Duganella aquatilis]